ncbi:MAG: hypothetical protein GTO12_18855 [Proteobacteria bacterium]|nr:hypothetical protein [Pseudomonadota bacterium]
MRTSKHVFILTALILSFPGLTLAEDSLGKGLDLISKVSSNKGEESLGKVFGRCLVERLYEANDSNVFDYDPSHDDVLYSEDLDMNTFTRATFGAVADTFKMTRLGKRLAELVAGYSRVEYVRYKSEEKGRLYALGKKASKHEEKDYRWLLIFHYTSSFPVELKGSFGSSNLSARFAEDKFGIGFESERLNEFVVSLIDLENATVHLNGTIEAEGIWFARFNLSF